MSLVDKDGITRAAKFQGKLNVGELLLKKKRGKLRHGREGVVYRDREQLRGELEKRVFLDFLCYYFFLISMALSPLPARA